ncbi:hypothetical protein LJB42_002223 [Komagataella kurtzmanii]|nr:hypothetical protein LJB42_002223 [Komagataella kurtzmanii]
MTAPEIYQIQDLTEDQKTFIRNSVPILKDAGETLTAKFYQYMISNYDEVKPYFNETNQKLLKQPRILAFALLKYAENIDDLSPLTAFVHQIVVKHVGLQIKAEHYPIVGGSLLKTMAELLGPELATPAFLKAWATAYGNLAQILINAEWAEFQKQKWHDFKEFKVTKIENECDDVKSVYFTPVEGEIAKPLDGQYVCIRWKLPGEKFEKSREYSLSSRPNYNTYRISVRLLENGKISTFVHNQLKAGDIITVAPPAGQLLYEESQKDAVFFIGGVGITPVVSIMETALERGQKVTLFYSNRTSKSTAFRGWLKELKSKFNLQLTVKEFISEEQVTEGVDQINSAQLQRSDIQTVSPENEVYLVGPVPYMQFVSSELNKLGVQNIHSEFFGPTVVA